jgi:hypothetical protein
MSTISIESFPLSPLFNILQRLELVTKNLKFQAIRKGEAARKLVVSTHLLAQMGYQKGDHLIEEVIGIGKGLRIRKAAIGEKKDKIVYSREYKKSKRVETLLDIRNQEKINAACQGASEANIRITKTEIIILPIYRPGDLKTNGATITIPSIKNQRDAIVSVLETMRGHQVNHANLQFDKDFELSHDFLLLKTQLRRDGFTLQTTPSGLTVYLNGHKFAVTKPLDLDEPKMSQAPPVVKNLNTFVALSGGVDAHLLEKEGFKVTHCLEFRPNEARDKTDKTEKYALALAHNSSCTHLYNENLYDANHEQIGKDSFNTVHGHFSLSCTDFSTLKTNAAKVKAFESLSTSRDLFIPLLALIRHMVPLTLSIENVPAFASSPECEILTCRLEKLGYRVSQSILNAPECGGLTKRKRLYLFASLYTHDLVMEDKTHTTKTAWEVIQAVGLDTMRDVTENKSVQLGVACGRIRLLTPETVHAPSIFRAQSRGVKDALYIKIKERYYMPTIEHLRALMGIPDTFEMGFLNGELQTEIIGNSVDAAMHNTWVRAIKRHIEAAMGATSQVKERIALVTKPSYQPDTDSYSSQLTFAF